MATYDDIRTELKTGDIVLFSGKGGVSEWIKWFTRSDYSHVGMVLRIPKFEIVLLWESTTLCNVKDVEAGRELQGVQLVPLSDRVKKYSGDIAIRRLDYGDAENDMEKMVYALEQKRTELKRRPYEEKIRELIRSAYDGPLGENTEDLSSVFCSELVAEAYQAMGLLPQDIPSNEYTPADFSKEAKKELPLLQGASLSDEIAITK